MFLLILDILGGLLCHIADLTTEIWPPSPLQRKINEFYNHQSEKKTWEEAQEFCRTNYTGLASVTSETSLRQLNLETVGTETESVWTGLRFMNGQWFWVSGEQLGSLVSMPSCPALSYRCGALNTTTNTLQNLNCNEKLNFVCYWN
ncbi:snaclec rhodocytin subunit alpha-like [Tachysurus vachellii]|uniref:snaclec rhodocytin subunit alpha-like n=1 Tax=Tachysurus vachellii TaxID=175792 RepID=UPI00296AEB54|nr:snaclec rhodocytin subunit alpha-like [Tachysurus vachellii]